MTNGAEDIIASDEARELAGLFGEPFTMEWRLGHAIAGDAAMSEVAELIPRFGEGASREDDVSIAVIVSAMAQVAQAHYAAANVRAKPGWMRSGDAPRPAPADKSWLRMRPSGKDLPVEQTPTGRIVTLAAGTEVTAEDLVALSAVGITVRWAEATPQPWSCIVCGSSAWVAKAHPDAHPGEPPYKSCQICGGMTPREEVKP